MKQQNQNFAHNWLNRDALDPTNHDNLWMVDVDPEAYNAYRELLTEGHQNNHVEASSASLESDWEGKSTTLHPEPTNASEPSLNACLEQRKVQWGDAYKQITGDWEQVLDIQHSPEEFIAMMLTLKLRRWKNSGYKAKDCLTDIVGYAKLGLSLN